MADALKDGLEKLRSLNRSQRSRTVTYLRGTVSATVLATTGQSDHEAKDRQGFAIKEQMTDFIISAVDLELFGEPKSGDTITFDGSIYKVLAPKGPTSEPQFRYTSAYREAYRIHTKETG